MVRLSILNQNDWPNKSMHTEHMSWSFQAPGGHKEFAATETVGEVHDLLRRSVLYVRLARVPIALHVLRPIHATGPCAR